MAAKIILCFASALFVKTISAQCPGAINSIAGTALAAEELALSGNALAYGSYAGGLGLTAAAPAYTNYGLAANSFVPTSGGGFAVNSFSPIAPTGITVISENAIEGAVAINGELPFLSVVALEGALPTAGAGGINYGCGNGAVGIVSESLTAPAAAAAYAPMGPAGVAPGAFGYGPGLTGLGALGFGFGAPALGYNGLASSGCGCGAIY